MSYKCNVCDIEFTCKQNLSRHNVTNRHKNMVSNTKKVYTCLCGKFYAHQPSYYRHKKSCKYKQPEEIETIFTDVPLENKILSVVELKLEEQRKYYEEEMTKLKDDFQKQLVIIKKNNIPALFVQSNRQKVSVKLREEIVQTQSNRCNECNGIMSEHCQIDHKRALQFGGTHEKCNLQALCYECHIVKSKIENQARNEIWEAITPVIDKYKSTLSF